MIDKELLEILACPICKSNVKYDSKKNIIKCENKKCNKNYKIEDNIPIMLA